MKLYVNQVYAYNSKTTVPNHSKVSPPFYLLGPHMTGNIPGINIPVFNFTITPRQRVLSWRRSSRSRCRGFCQAVRRTRLIFGTAHGRRQESGGKTMHEWSSQGDEKPKRREVDSHERHAGFQVDEINNESDGAWNNVRLSSNIH